MARKDNEGYYALSFGVSIVLALLVHYLFISGIKINSTLHAAIGIVLWFIFNAVLSPVFEKLW